MSEDADHLHSFDKRMIFKGDFMNFWEKNLFLAATILGGTLIFSQMVQADQEFAKTTGKKLIEYGWDQFYAPEPEFIRDNIREMEKRPFEGIIFRLPSQQSDIFKVGDWQENAATRQKYLDILASIKWDKFTDNFLGIYASSDMDWYSDEDWEKVLSKTKYNAAAAKTAGCVGIMFDPESYGGSPWKYADQKRISEYDFAHYSKQAHKRGKQFMQALQGKMPQIKILMFYQYSGVLWESHSSDATERQAALQKSNYGLMIPFLDGMLEVANDGVQLIDGNENAYYYKTAKNFDDGYKKMKQDAKINVPQNLWQKFDQHVRAGSSLYVDQIYGLRSKTTTWQRPVLAFNMTQEQRNKWFEHNVYYSLKTSDEYVWLYSERADWFEHPMTPNATGNNKSFRESGLPEGITQAIISAKNKLQNDQSLGYNMEPIYKDVEAKIKAKEQIKQ